LGEEDLAFHAFYLELGGYTAANEGILIGKMSANIIGCLQYFRCGRILLNFLFSLGQHPLVMHLIEETNHFNPSLTAQTFPRKGLENVILILQNE
jgi:hypothetical protein